MNYKLPACFTVMILLGFGCVNVYAQSSQSIDDEVRTERRFFDFLIGEWKIERSETPDGVEVGGDSTYKFSSVLGGNGVQSDWYFNRGSKAKPDYTNAIYITAFDNTSRAWSFYYISEKSAQWWEGKKEDGQWRFYKKFMSNGEEILQRQEWRLRDRSTLVRVIENSKDAGKTWATYLFIFKRKEK